VGRPDHPKPSEWARIRSLSRVSRSWTWRHKPSPRHISTEFRFLPTPSFDGEAARKEALIRLRGLADHFEEEDPAMHKTNTVDYAVVYDGEIWLELDDAKTVHLKKGDVVLQNGTRHAWRNKGTAPVTMLFFLNGANE